MILSNKKTNQRVKFSAIATGLSLILAGINPAIAEKPDLENDSTFTPEKIAKVEFNWAMHCQGCHGLDGVGNEQRDVPPLQGHVAKFLNSNEGREFLIRVPGVSGAPLSNDDLADILNWMILTMDHENIPDDWARFYTEEIGLQRKHPLRRDVFVRREQLLKDINEYLGKEK